MGDTKFFDITVLLFAVHTYLVLDLRLFRLHEKNKLGWLLDTSRTLSPLKKLDLHTNRYSAENDFLFVINA